MFVFGGPLVYQFYCYVHYPLEIKFIYLFIYLNVMVVFII